MIKLLLELGVSLPVAALKSHPYKDEHYA
jgi:hypothetical protein